MRIAFIFNECAEALKTQVRTYWAAKQHQLEQLLPPGSPGETSMDVVVHHESQASRYEVRVVLPLPSVTLTAEAGDADVQTALDRVAQMLTQAASQGLQAEARRTDGQTEDVDATSADSFPASDAPSWTSMTASGVPPLPEG